jgi:hypothetical protein
MGPSLNTDYRRPHGLPNIDERGPRHEDVGLAESLSDSRFPTPFDQMVDQNSQPSGWPRPELNDGPIQVIDPVEALDHHTLDAQVVTPHPLDQFGVVDSLDPDAPRPGHPGRSIGNRYRTGCSVGWPPGGPGCARPDEADRLAINSEGAGGEPEDPHLAGLAPELHTSALQADQGAAEPARPVNQRHAGYAGHFRVGGGQLVGGRGVDRPGQDARGPTW